MVWQPVLCLRIISGRSPHDKQFIVCGAARSVDDSVVSSLEEVHMTSSLLSVEQPGLWTIQLAARSVDDSVVSSLEEVHMTSSLLSVEQPGLWTIRLYRLWKKST
ncbi:hypothetical protein BaRGS_00029933 [Batillaria attramentaria]|uniref:Uncharacterized protein n=1 Tax=Batillaria attramentaria TaxID=370345 RepID=A0ABD0JUS8_9CAEN